KEHTRQNSEVNKDSWAAEISGKISLINEPLQDFFEDYVPCHSKFEGHRPWTDPAEVFKAVPSSGKETDKYPHLIKGLRQLVSGFDDVRRPKFADGSKCAVRFPFKEWEEEHHYTLPDILMSFPGEDDNDDTWAKTWHRIAMVCEVKNADDPINESAPWASVRQSGTGVLTQLAKSARNLMLTHGMLFVFVVGIYKDSARIYRFDRAACVVSRSIDIKKKPWPLHELLWRICHYEAPVGGVPGATPVARLLGEDPTLFRASEQDKDMADDKCKEIGQRPLSEDERRACRWMTVAKYDSDGSLISSTRVLLYRIRSLNPRLFSRATVVWEGYEDGTWKRLAVKDAWRQVARDREDAFYDQIRESMQDRGELFGLARMKCGDDLGAREAAKLVPCEDGSCPWPAPYEFYHRTVCRGPPDAAGRSDESEYNERSHMRLVFETVGRPLSQFKSTKELIRGFRDAIYGHRQAYRAGIIHRDISENNVMLSDDLMSFFVGFLLDFYYGFNWKELLKRAGWEVTEESWKRMKLKERTGTLYFMAVEILKTHVTHDARHDLESFFWLLLWVVLRYTATTCSPPNEPYLSVFGQPTDLQSAFAKSAFLTDEMYWEVKDNKPLTTLIRKYKQICYFSSRRPLEPTSEVPLTYDAVLDLFDEALAAPDWPQNDHALPFQMPTKAVPSASQVGSRAAGSR
ncbi:hypothetical protein FOMPIDRAFT_1100799, partial [Fomitopsis schrenkii]